MRIALVTEYYYPHLGGVTEHVHNLAFQLSRMGHRPLIVTSNMKGQDRDEDPPFVRRIGRSQLIFANGSFGRITLSRHLSRQVENLFREEAVDLVHVHSALAPTLNVAAQRAAHRLGIPVVATCHSWFPWSLANWVLRQPLQRQLDALAARIAVSEPVVQANARYFRTTWEVIPNGVDTTYFHPNGRATSDALTSGPRLLFLGRMDPRNGLPTALEAMPEILRHYPKTVLLVAGDGALLGHYERQARALGDRVRFIGRVLEERPFYYGSCDIYLCPTSRASFGITLLEAMACGLPMLVSNITGFRELVAGGEEALLLPPRDARAWARAAVELIGNPARRQAMRQAGLRKAAEFSWSQIAEKVVGIYKGALR